MPEESLNHVEVMRGYVESLEQATTSEECIRCLRQMAGWRGDEESVHNTVYSAFYGIFQNAESAVVTEAIMTMRKIPLTNILHFLYDLFEQRGDELPGVAWFVLREYHGLPEEKDPEQLLEFMRNGDNMDGLLAAQSMVEEDMEVMLPHMIAALEVALEAEEPGWGSEQSLVYFVGWVMRIKGPSAAPALPYYWKIAATAYRDIGWMATKIVESLGEAVLPYLKEAMETEPNWVHEEAWRIMERRGLVSTGADASSVERPE